MNPEVGEIWRWESGGPLLLLEVLESHPKDETTMFLCLDLARNLKYTMSFSPYIMKHWTRLA